MKKTVSTPCFLMLLFGMLFWMGIAEGWSDLVVDSLWFVTTFCLGITFGGLAYSFKKEVIDKKGGE